MGKGQRINLSELKKCHNKIYPFDHHKIQDKYYVTSFSGRGSIYYRFSKQTH